MVLRDASLSKNLSRTEKNMEFFWYLVRVFVVGGGFCVLAQLLIDLTALTPARILVLYVVLGVFLGAVGLYEPIKAFAGSGISVTLIGFGGTIAKGVKAAVYEQGLLGALTGSLTAAAGGTAAALVFGLIAAICVRSKPKR